MDDKDFDELVELIKARWPEHARSVGFWDIPPVRDNGRTAALIRLAVRTCMGAEQSSGEAWTDDSANYPPLPRNYVRPKNDGNRDA